MGLRPPLDVVLDVDTGVDDALALLLAARSPRVRLLAVTCAEGNVDVDRAVRNTLTVLAAAGCNAPVARGAERPLTGPPSGGRGVHGPDGLAGLTLPPAGLPPPGRRPVAAGAVELLLSAITGAAGPVTVLGLAPTTNLALLLSAHPEVAAGIARVVLVAGAPPGAEPDFNLAHDPEAAAVVLASGVPVTAYGTGVLPLAAVPAGTAHRLAGSVDAGTRLAGLLLAHQVRRAGGGAGSLGDAGALAAVLDPGGLRVERRRLRAGLAGGERGRLVEGAYAVDVAVDADGARYGAAFVAAMAGTG